MTNNPRPLKKHGWCLVGYETVIKGMSTDKSDNLTNFRWMELNGPYSQYYEDGQKPLAHHQGLIRFRRKNDLSST